MTENPAPLSFDALETPRLLIDPDRLQRNCDAMRERCRALGIRLRPHLKTAKSLDVARVALAGEFGPITVSTLREAEHFARGGYRDILYAVAIAPAKLAHAARLRRETGAELLLLTDTDAIVAPAERAAEAAGTVLPFLIEIDCGEHRGGLAPGDPAVVALARQIDASPHLSLAGVMTHAGHSYATDDPQAVRTIAREEREAVTAAARALLAAGLPCGIVSLGSSPTAMFADDLAGVTEIRAGIYMTWDLAQLSRHVCREEDIAVSVLASVIGHNRAESHLVLDAGALALSKDVSAQRFLPDCGYGYVCDSVTLARHGPLAVDVVHQEHGTVRVADPAWFDRLPVGTLVRVLPNHACVTAAAYDAFDVVRDGRVEARWSRINGW